MALGTQSWYAISSGTGLHLTGAGHYYGLVSIPIFQFLYPPLVPAAGDLVRAVVAHIEAESAFGAHPPRPGGRNRVSRLTWQAFGLIGLAQSSLLAGLVASRIYFEDQNLMSFKVSIAVLAGFFLLAILGPLTMFTPRLFRTKRKGLMQYGTLATNYVACFDKKWARGGGKGEEMLGSPDIQSLADLGGSYAAVREMRLVPFGLDDVLPLAGIAVLPLLPLLVTVMPLDEILTRVLKTIF